MKNTKKGFTLVELLVVIAMLAILSTVTIVGLTGCIEEAKLSVDAQGVEQMNTALEASSVTGIPQNFKEFVEVLDGAGFNTDEGIHSLVDGYAIYWFKAYNVVVLAKDDGTVVSPAEDLKMVEAFDINGEGVYNLAMCGSKFYVGDTPVETLQEALNLGGTIDITEDIVIDTMVQVTKDTTLNLNGYSIKSTIATGRAFNLVEDGAKLTINAEESEIEFGAYGLVAMKGSTSGIIDVEVVINGGYFEGEMKNGAFIKAVENVNATVTLNNVTYKDNSNAGNTDVGEAVSYIITNNSGRNATIDLTVNGGSYDADCGFFAHSAEFNGVTINSRGYCIYALSATIDNCNLTTTNVHDVAGKTPAACVATSNNGSVTVKNSALDAGEGNATHVYPTGGTIELTECAVIGNHYVHDPYAGATSTIIVDGVASSKTGE